LLLLLLLIGLLLGWYDLADQDLDISRDINLDTVTETSMLADGEDPTGANEVNTVYSLSQLTSLATSEDIEGVSVNLSDVEVVDLYSDRGFVVSDGTINLRALLEQELDLPESQTDINVGQTLSLSGEIITLDDSRRDLSSYESDNLELDNTARFYLLVESVDIELPA
jgi:hypothetical protein